MVIFLAHSYLHELIYVLIKRIYFTTRETGCWKIYGLCCSLLMCGQNLLIGLKKMQYIVKSNFHSSLRHVRSKSFVCRHKFDRNNCKVSKNYVIYVLVNPIPGFCWTLHFFWRLSCPIYYRDDWRGKNAWKNGLNSIFV